MKNFEREWQGLHQSFMHYETLAFTNKAIAVLAFLFALQMSLPVLITLLVMATIWLHEGMLRTAQTRIYSRLLFIESENKTDNTIDNYHYCEFEHTRPGAIKLVKLYILACLKPTIAITYLALLALTILVSIL